MGPKRQPGTAANLVAGQAAGPLERTSAPQNCPQPYQGESGGLEPAMKPMAGQAGAPRGRGPSAEGPPLRGRSALTGGPVPPCAPLPSGGISISAARRAKEIASLRGLPRPRSIFGHFLLIKKVATSASGFCLTFSQTDTLPMAQLKKESQRFR